MAVNMVPMKSVVVIRDGNRVKPEIGKTFAFTKEEKAALIEADPASLRKPTDESADADDNTTAAVSSAAEKSQSKARGGRKAPTADKADSEVKSEDDTDPDAGAAKDDDL